MGKYFADVHASHESQFQNLPHGLADTDEILTCRAKPQTYENLLELADALCWQLRFREAIDALTQAVKLEPECMEAYRKRGPKYLDTLQFERALTDYTRCEQADGVSVMSRYRIGMAHYLMGQYDAAVSAFSKSLALAPQDGGARCRWKWRKPTTNFGRWTSDNYQTRCTVTGGAYHSARKVSMCVRNICKSDSCLNRTAGCTPRPQAPLFSPFFSGKTEKNGPSETRRNRPRRNESPLFAKPLIL